MIRQTSPKHRILQSALLTAGLLMAISPAQALNQFLRTWEDTYPNSHSGNADCSLCHTTSNSNLNAYGKALCDAFNRSLPADITAGLKYIEESDSDSDPTASTNLEEIDANAQPGWTAGTANPVYAADVGGGCTYVGLAGVPSSVPLPYDPPVNGEPVADPNGPYTGNVNVPIILDGSGSYDSDASDVITSYAWTFGDESDDVLTSEPTVSHTYTMPGDYIVGLTVTDDEGYTNTNSTLVTISAGDVLDLDIVSFKVSKTASVGKPISIQLAVENPGTVLGQAVATVVGMQGGAEVYRWNLNVYDYNGKGATSFSFPTYKASARGTINWAVTISDVNPDTDLASATTNVR